MLALIRHGRLQCAAGLLRCSHRLLVNYQLDVHYAPHSRCMGGGPRNRDQRPKKHPLSDNHRKPWVWTKFRMERLPKSSSDDDKRDNEIVLLQATNLNRIKQKVAEFYKVDYKDLTREVLQMEMWDRKLKEWVALDKYKQIGETYKQIANTNPTIPKGRFRKDHIPEGRFFHLPDKHRQMKETYDRELRMFVVRDKDKQLWDLNLQKWVAVNNDEPLTTKNAIPKVRIKEVATNTWEVLEKHKRMTELTLRRIPTSQRILIRRMQKQSEEEKGKGASHNSEKDSSLIDLASANNLSGRRYFHCDY